MLVLPMAILLGSKGMLGSGWAVMLLDGPALRTRQSRD